MQIPLSSHRICTITFQAQASSRCSSQVDNDLNLFSFSPSRSRHVSVSHSGWYPETSSLARSDLNFFCPGPGCILVERHSQSSFELFTLWTQLFNGSLATVKNNYISVLIVTVRVKHCASSRYRVCSFRITRVQPFLWRIIFLEF